MRLRGAQGESGAPLAPLCRVRYPAAMADNHGHRRREVWARESACPPAHGDSKETTAIKQLLAKSFLKEAEVQLVKPLCDSCPVKRECFDWAIVHDEWGYYGGFTRKQRKEFYGLTEELAVQAVKEHWLEGYNRLSEDMLRRVLARAAQEIAREKEEAAKKKNKPIIVVTTTEFDWSLPEALPALQFS